MRDARGRPRVAHVGTCLGDDVRDALGAGRPRGVENWRGVGRDKGTRGLAGALVLHEEHLVACAQEHIKEVDV